jgi:TetR/AcrR family transcriptional regulator
VATVSWAERAAERSPLVQRSRTRSIQQAQVIVDAARRLSAEKGSAFTTQELAKEAGVALQTFYRHFASKDELLLAVLEEIIAQSCAAYREQALELPDPLARLHFYVGRVLDATFDDDRATRQFTTSEHYRLQQLFPEELAIATKPFADLLVPEITEAQAAGLLAPGDVERSAWFVTQLVMATFHHYAFVNEPMDDVGEELWRFCLRALGGDPEGSTVARTHEKGRAGAASGGRSR